MQKTSRELSHASLHAVKKRNESTSEKHRLRPKAAKHPKNHQQPPKTTNLFFTASHNIYLSLKHNVYIS
jgi:hypothetical protein